MLTKLKERRQALRLTQSELASKLNMTRRSVIRWEKGQAMPSTKKLRKLAELMGCSPEDFFKIQPILNNPQDQEAAEPGL